MTVHQITLFVCEVCGKVSTSVEQVDLYSDPMIYPPKDEKWGYPSTKVSILHCPDCYKKEENKHEGKLV